MERDIGNDEDRWNGYDWSLVLLTGIMLGIGVYLITDGTKEIFSTKRIREGNSIGNVVNEESRLGVQQMDTRSGQEVR